MICARIISWMDLLIKEGKGNKDIESCTLAIRLSSISKKKIPYSI